MALNQGELIHFLKGKKKFMSAKEIANETNSTITAINRKLQKICSCGIQRKVKRLILGKSTYKRPVNVFKWKGE